MNQLLFSAAIDEICRCIHRLAGTSAALHAKEDTDADTLGKKIDASTERCRRITERMNEVSRRIIGNRIYINPNDPSTLRRVLAAQLRVIADDMDPPDAGPKGG